MCHNPRNKLFPFWHCNYPIEEIAFDRTFNTRCLKSLSRKKSLWIVLLHLQHGDRDAFRDYHKKRVLKPKSVTFDLSSVD